MNKRKAARKPKRPTRDRINLSVTLTPSALAEFDKRASEMGLSKSFYLETILRQTGE